MGVTKSRKGSAGWLVSALALAMLVPGAVLAQGAPPRAALHDGFGRMVFDWDGPVGFTAQASDGRLVVTFNKPYSGDPGVVARVLSPYLKGASLSADRTTITFPLAVPVTVKSFRKGNGVVIDLIREVDAKGERAKTGAPVAQTAETGKAAVAGSPATPVMVRGGDHDGFSRVVFDWPKPVGHRVETAEGQVTISFDRAAVINPTALKASLPPGVGIVETRPSGKGTAVVLSIQPGMQARSFTIGPRVAVDLVRGAAPPATAAASSAGPSSPVADKPAAPAPSQAQTAVVPPAVPAAPAVPAPAPAVPAPAPAPAVPAPAPAVPARSTPHAADATVVSLGFSFDKPTGAAVFRRGGWLWAVFDHKTDIDTALLKRTGGEVVRQVEQVEGVKGTAVRILTLPGYNPSVRKEGQLWVLDIHEQALHPKSIADVRPQLDFQDRGRLLIAAADGSPTMLIRDPEVGDIIQVVALPAVGFGVQTGRDYPGFELLTTAQGIAAVARADSVRLEPGKASVEVTMPGGLYLSPMLPPSDAAVAAEPAPAAAAPVVADDGLMDINGWMRGGPDSFRDERRTLLGRLAAARPADRNAIRLDIARHYLANGFAPEALGELRQMAASDPAQADNPAFRAVRGAANVIAGHDAEAIPDLSIPELKDDPRAQLFLATAMARSRPDPAQQALALRLAPDEIKGWPRTLRMTIGDVATRSLVAAGDGKGAAQIVNAMMGPNLSTRDVAHLSYLMGLASVASKQFDQAITRFREAEASESRPDRAYATRDRVELMLKQEQITSLQAIDELEKLRFTWRGEDFEFQLLKRLGELQLAAGRYGDGLRSLRQVAANFPDHPDAAKVKDQMHESFRRLFLEGAADSLPPVTAIGLFNEFKDLVPSGGEGDEMFRRLADRLASVDLLDQASELLRHQVVDRLNGIEKTRIGTRLAFLNLSNRKPRQAVEALDLSETPDLPPDLAAQRRYLRVKALDDLGRSADALALIVNDQSEEANRLRGEIYWRLKKWPEAASALESTLVPPLGNRPLEPQMAQRVLDTATALTLARDERALARLRRSYGDLMAKTDLREAFDLLTSEPERGIADYRRIGDKIKQVENFQTFMGEWKNRVKASGLSSMN